MKTIGLLGGMSWQSTLLYYELINQAVKDRLGGLHSAKIAMKSVDFGPIAARQHDGDWDRIGQILGDEAKAISAAGADFLLVATNTMHLVAAQIEAASGLPLLHIADATGERLRRAGHQRVGFLGTAFSMEHGFYTDRLQALGLTPLVPDPAGRKRVHDIIYSELCLGKVTDSSRAVYVEQIDKLAADGATAVILGCTEITLLVDQQHSVLPVFDTTAIHAEAAVDLALVA